MDMSCDVENFSKLRGQYSEKYTPEDLRVAIEKIRNNDLSYGAASKMYNVPKTTLFNKMKNPDNCPKGATTILSKDQEEELAEWILLSADYGDPRTKQDIIIAAGEIAQLDVDTSNHFKNDIPTSGWFDGFLKRHPECRPRKPQSMSKASAINTKDDFSGMWRNIYKYFERTNQLELLNKPELWWNADETGFEKDKLPKKVYARKGTKRVSRREMGPPKDNTTVTYAFSAAGDFVEPLITLKDSNSSIAEIAFALGSVGANYGINQTDSGWTKTESFFYFVSIHLHNQWEAKQIPKPRILTIDGYGAHFSLRLFRWARLNGVIIIKLYPGGTPYLQMCDTTMFSPMKAKHEQLYSQWRLQNPTKTMNDVEFVKILKQINDAVIKKESIINGWRSTGLQPFNFNNLKTDGLLCKSPDRSYDFKGDYIDSAEVNSTESEIATQPKVNVLSDVVLDPSSDLYIHQGNYLNMNDTPLPPIPSTEDKNTNNQDDIRIDENVVPVVELIDIEMDEIPEGPVPAQSNFIAIKPILLDTPEENSGSYQQYPLQELQVNQTTSLSSNDQVRINNVVKLSELAGHGEIFSQFDANLSLGSFGLSDGRAETSDGENSSRIGKLAEKIRRDIKQLGLLCAASDKEKLINVLVINQQLNIIDPPVVEQSETTLEPRSIKSILIPPTMPQRVKPKRNLNLKVSYGVVTAKEVVQSLIEREAADRQQEIEREEDEISKLERDNEIKLIDEQMKDIRKMLSSARSENVALNKEMTQKKKNKSIRGSDLALKEAEKDERENIIKQYDDQLRELRDKMKDLKTIHVTTNKAVLLKRKNFEQQKKDKGNQVQPSITPIEADESELDSESY